MQPLERKIENTDAESVDDIVEANRKEVIKPILADLIVIPKIHQTKMPVKSAVKKNSYCCQNNALKDYRAYLVNFCIKTAGKEYYTKSKRTKITCNLYILKMNA